MWLLPSLLLGPVLIIWFSRTHKYSRAPGGAAVGPRLPPCGQTAAHQLDSDDGRTWWAGKSRQQWLAPSSARVLCWSCPHSPCAWRKPWTMEQQGDTLLGGATSYQSCSTQFLSRWNPPHFTDEHPEVSVTQAGLELMVSDSKSIVVFILPATSGTAPRRSWQVLETLTETWVQSLINSH